MTDSRVIHHGGDSVKPAWRPGRGRGRAGGDRRRRGLHPGSAASMIQSLCDGRVIGTRPGRRTHLGRVRAAITPEARACASPSGMSIFEPPRQAGKTLSPMHVSIPSRNGDQPIRWVSPAGAGLGLGPWRPEEDGASALAGRARESRGPRHGGHPWAAVHEPRFPGVSLRPA